MFPEYLPDQPGTGQLLTTCQNVIPSQGGYNSVPSYQAQTNAIPAAFGGGGAFIAQDGTVLLLAGTDAGIHKLVAPNWTSITSAGAGRWHFVQFKSFAIGTNGANTQVVDLLAGTGATLTDAPIGTSIGVVGPHVVIGGAAGNRLRVQWSAFDDHTGWTPAVNQSGFQGLNDGGEVMGVASGEYGVILQRFALTRMTLTANPLEPFQFQQISNNFGCAAKSSIVQAGRTIFFLSDRGFVALENGLQLRPIGNQKIDDSFRAAVPQADYERLFTAVDPKRTLAFWGIPGNPGTIWCYNWTLDRWSTLSFPFTAFFTGYQASLTLEAVSAAYPNLDTMGFSLDDARFQGGDPRLYFVGSDNTVGALAGPTLAATFTLGWQELFPGKRTRVRGAWPTTDAVAGMAVTVDARQRMGDAEKPVMATSMEGSGRIPVRASGRYSRITVTHGAGSLWTYSQGIEIEAEAAGER